MDVRFIFSESIPAACYPTPKSAAVRMSACRYALYSGNLCGTVLVAYGRIVLVLHALHESISLRSQIFPDTNGVSFHHQTELLYYSSIQDLRTPYGKLLRKTSIWL